MGNMFLTEFVSYPAVKGQMSQKFTSLCLAGEHSGVTWGGKHPREKSRPHLCYDG